MVSMASPCQCVRSGSVLVFITSMVTGTPSRSRSSGPGTCPLNANVFTDTPGPISIEHRSIRRLWSAAPAVPVA